VLRKETPDVVEVGSPFLAPWLLQKSQVSPAPATLGFYHADLVRTFAEPYVPYRWAAPLRVALRMAARRYVRDVYRTFDLTVAASRSVVKELEEFGVPRVAPVSLGVNLKLFRLRGPHEVALRSRYGLPEHRPVALFVGRFAAEKRLDVILDGHAKLPEETRPHVVLVGDGPQRPQLEARATRQAHLSILPYQSSREELARLYGACDMYLAAGPGETFGLSIAEGLASGLPVVSVNRGGGPDRVEGCDASELYEHGNPEDAARALQRMTRRLSPELRSRARIHAEEQFDWDRTFARMVELYEELAARRRR
jgi:alpha-1,6-mannosyltransferase